MSEETLLEKEPTLEEMAKIYVDTLYSSANGHGQHVHPVYGRSDHIMRRMWERFGKVPSNKAIDAALHENRQRRFKAARNHNL